MIIYLNFLLALLALLAQGAPALASASDAAALPVSSQSLVLETTAGVGTLSDALTFMGTRENSTKNALWKWNTTYSYSTNRQSGITDNTSQFVGSAGYGRNVAAELGLTYATTPAEGLHDVGPSLALGYSSKTDLDEEIEFRPSFSVKAQFSYLDYVDDYAIPRSPKTQRLQGGSTSIVQRSLGLSGDYYPWEWVDARWELLRYFYSKGISDFMNSIDNPKSLNLGVTGFSSTLGGFPLWTIHPGAQFILDLMWNADVDFSYSRNAIDTTHQTSLRGTVTRSLADMVEGLNLGLGIEHDASQDSGDQNLGFVQVTYDF